MPAAFIYSREMEIKFNSPCEYFPRSFIQHKGKEKNNNLRDINSAVQSQMAIRELNWISIGSDTRTHIKVNQMKENFFFDGSY